MRDFNRGAEAGSISRKAHRAGMGSAGPFKVSTSMESLSIGFPYPELAIEDGEARQQMREKPEEAEKT